MKFQPAIASMSLGRAWLHDMEVKLDAASTAGFQGIEIFYEDLEYVAKSLSNSEEDCQSPDTLLAAAKVIREMCDSKKLTVIGLQPFLFYEGLHDRVQHAKLIEKLHVWFRLVQTLGTDIIQIPSNFLPPDQITGDMETIVSDMIEVAELGLQQSPPIRFAYENLCWGTYIDTWEKAWEVVKQVDRPNFGLCLDTFNIAGAVWADPASPTGMVKDADAKLDASLQRLVEEIDISKVFYIQVVDAERLEKPLDNNHPYYVDGQPSRMSWSRNARCFLYETDRGAYLPVQKVAKCIICGMGYEGYVSMELFSRTMVDPAPEVPREHANRGITAWKRFEEVFNLNDDE